MSAASDWDAFWVRQFRQHPEWFQIQAEKPSGYTQSVPLGLLAGKTVLDYGCGYGKLGRDAAILCGHYYGVDVSPLAIQLARIMVPRNATFYVLGTDAHPRGLDTIIARDVLIHQNRAKAAELLAMFRRLLRPGGILWCNFYNAASDGPNVRDNDAPMGRVSRCYRYTAAQVASLFADWSSAGFAKTTDRHIVTACPG